VSLHRILLVFSAAPTDFDIRTELFEVGGPDNSMPLCKGRYLWTHIDPMPIDHATSGSAPVPACFVDEIIVNPTGVDRRQI
jgi:hypothetical protein